jgi:hypothetical protein
MWSGFLTLVVNRSNEGVKEYGGGMDRAERRMNEEGWRKGERRDGICVI